MRIYGFLKRINSFLFRFGLDLPKFFHACIPLSFKWYYKDYKVLLKQRGNDTTFHLARFFWVTRDREDQGGTMKGHYFHQDLFVAKKIYKANPARHIDIGSRTDGFVAHVASFREIELIDIRNIESNVENIKFTQADLMKLHSNLIDSCDSVSSLHAIEHFGLGRYGDPIDYFGHLKAIKNITQMLKRDGMFYFSVPIGEQRIEFNAHRVFSIEYILQIFEKDYQLVSFSYVDDLGDFYQEIQLTKEKIMENCGCRYGCGIFLLSKK